MHSTAARSNRTPLQSSIPPTTTPSSILHPQQQQILYGPIINPMLTLQPCGTGLHPSCIYPGAQRNGVPNPVSLHIQVQLSYNPKPLVLFDQTANNAPPPAPTASFLVASSTYTHGSFSGDQYNNSGVTLIPQPYYKPPDVQVAYCLVQDQQTAQQQQQEQPSHGSYYNISATNTCNLQTVNTHSTFQFSNLSPYAPTNFNNQILGPVQTVQPAKIFPSPPVNLVLAGPQRDKPVSTSTTLDVSAFKCTNSKITGNATQIAPIVSEGYNEWPFQTIATSANSLFDGKPTTDDARQEATTNSLDKVTSNVSTKTQDEHYSDESSASFDFTIEAEKMVSALCNTSSNDLGKEERKGNKSNSAPLFSGAGDTISNKNTWFPDFCASYGSGTSVAIQTDSPCADDTHYPELLRKVIYWGCSEAETILTNSCKTNPRSGWLKNLSTATKIAITKSSTCFPVFAGNHVFTSDLINALLRISNGWLILDNYLNKQHYSSLDEKYDKELVRFAEPDRDVSVYTNCDLFDPSTNASRLETGNKKNDQESSLNVATQLSVGSLRNIGLYNQEKQAPKESKLRRHADTGVPASSRFRSRGSSSSAKIDSSSQSLNAEFFHLRSKVLTENNQDYSRQWTFKEKKQEFVENKVPTHENSDTIFRLPRQMAENYDSNYTHKCLSTGESSFLNPMSLESMYFTSNNETENFDPNYTDCSSYRKDYGDKSMKTFDQNQGNKGNMDLVYVGKSSTSQLELATVPKDKMTLLSQIEPSIPDKSSEEMTANLSAWFASMRNSETGNVMPRLPTRQEMPKNTMDLSNCIRQLQIDANRQFQTLQNMQSIQSAPWNSYNLINNRIQVQQVHEEYDSSEDGRVYMKPGSYNVPKKRHQRRSTRRLDNSLPRNAVSGSTNSHRTHNTNKEKVFFAPTPGTTHLSRTTTTSVSTSANNPVNTSVKLPFPATPIVPPPVFSLENSPRILKRIDATSYAVSEDVTWKAACASAEILLEALNVKEDVNVNKEEDHRSNPITERDNITKEENVDPVTQFVQSQEKLQESFSKTLKDDNDGLGGASSYEASEDDSGSTYHFSPNASINEALQSSESKNGSSKMNVKTDSWLIRTLNNASMANKQKRRKNSTDPHTSESSNSSVMEDEQPIPILSLTTTATTIATTTTLKNLQSTSYSRKSLFTPFNSNQTTTTTTTPEEMERVAGKATYSETVRRCTPLNSSQSDKKEFCRKGKLNILNSSAICSTVIPIPGRRCQRKESEKSHYLLHNRQRKCPAKRLVKNCEITELQMEEISYTKPRNTRTDTIKENAFGIPSGTSLSSAITTKHGKKKKENVGFVEFLDGKFGGKTSDRGWSVWYSSKRKQSLSPLALSKLEMIHRMVWQMEEAEIFKCPSSADSCGNQASAHAIEDYCKVIKNPMFLETVEYKLKNRVYHKVEHAVRDFRRIVYNSKLYHKNDHDRVKTIETLSKKLEELFEEHFASWDFDNISGSPREVSPVSHRFKSAGKKTVTGRYGNTKKSPPVSITENI
ncbi:Bromodomain-containing protein 2 [Dufourea novaeangliae]|uniref:Bromodomain-containing protein 2 n=1 Tax=Dufourea novaeangliae TaxID=178035 RepID=A0A154PCC6_DUFNO|nr:Bromodomain-containing protein 2 [Dufourea novaeangliae]